MNPIDFIAETDNLGDADRLNQAFDWAFWLLMAFNLCAFAYVRTAQPGYIRVLFRTALYNRQLYQNTQEGLRLNGGGSVLLTLAYFNCLAVILGSQMTGPTWLPFVLLGGVCLVIALKYVLMKSVSFITQVNAGISEHWMNHLIFFQVTAILATPVICLTYSLSQTVQFSLYNGLILFIAAMIFLREIQSLLRAVRLRVSLFYIILYLCTLELLPAAVVIKALVR